MNSNLRLIPSAARKTLHRAFASDAGPPLMWKLTHGMFDPEISMAEKYPGIPDSVPIPAPSPTTPQTTTLPNGARVVSQDMGGPVSAVALFVAAGSRNENPLSTGVSCLLERLAFKGSALRSKFRMTRDMERTGGIFNASASRETIAYSAEGLREKLPEMVSIITESAVLPITAVQKHGAQWDMAMEEISSQVTVMKEDIKNISKDPSAVVTEAVHATAFHANSLGLPLVPPEYKLDQLNPAAVAQFVSDNFTPDRLVLSAANVDHETLVDVAGAVLGDISGSGGPNDEARYTGGGSKLSAEGPAQVAIGFQGVSWADSDLVSACVLHSLLGGGGSFSSGGPGKGMYTRLYSEVLNKYGWVTSATAFNHCYSDTGLFGIHASCDDPAALNQLVEVVGTQVGKMAGPLASGELDRAKAMTKSSLIMNLESRGVVCEDLGRQILSSGVYAGPEELVAKINAVTEDDIRRVAAKMTSSTPSVVTYGEEYATYDQAAIAAAIKKQVQLSA